MEYKYPHALWTWVRENKFHIRHTPAPPEWPEMQKAHLEVLKDKLIQFERDFRGARSWLGTYKGPRFDMPKSNLHVRAASAALCCAEMAVPLVPDLPGQLWGVFNNFMRLPAIEAPRSITYTLLDTLTNALNARPQLRLIDGGTEFKLIARSRHSTRTDWTTSLPLPVYSPAIKGSATVADEVQYLQLCRQNLPEDVKRAADMALEYLRRMEEIRERSIEEEQRTRAQRQSESARVQQLLRSFHQLLSDADRELIRKHPKIFQEVFGKD